MLALLVLGPPFPAVLLIRELGLHVCSNGDCLLFAQGTLLSVGL